MTLKFQVVEVNYRGLILIIIHGVAADPEQPAALREQTRLPGLLGRSTLAVHKSSFFATSSCAFFLTKSFRIQIKLKSSFVTGKNQFFLYPLKLSLSSSNCLVNCKLFSCLLFPLTHDLNFCLSFFLLRND